MALTDNLISYWKLDESSTGSSAVTRNDSHGTNHLTDNNTTASATGKIGNGADFEAANQEYLSIADASQTGLDQNDLSFNCWLNVESQPGTNISYAIFSKWIGETGNRGIMARYDDNAGTKQIRVFTSSNGTSQTFGGINQTLSNATWYMFTYTKSGTTGTVYINGSSIGTITATSTIFNNTAPFWIGNRGTNVGPFDHFDGIIDEAGYWSRALTSTEVTQLYNGGSGLAYPFTAGTATTPLLMLMGMGS